MQGLGRAGMGKSWDGPGNGPTRLPHPCPVHPVRLATRALPSPFSSNTSLAGGHSGWKCLLKYHLYILGIDLSQNMQAYEGLSKSFLKWEMFGEKNVFQVN